MSKKIEKIIVVVLMNRGLKCFAVLLLPFIAACSAVSGSGKKDRDLLGPSRPALARSPDLPRDGSDYRGKKLAGEFCSYAPSAASGCSLLDTLEKSCVRPDAHREKLPLEEFITGFSEKSAPARPLKFPVASGCLSSPFGYRHGVFHSGVDITAPTGTPILACAEGKVLCAGTRKRYSRYGKSVIIDHGKGLCTHYAHASVILVRAGQKVRKGQEIARVGRTGRTTCSHLHLEVLENERPTDPLRYFPERELHEVKVARNFSNKPAGPVVARSPLAGLVSRNR